MTREKNKQKHQHPTVSYPIELKLAPDFEPIGDCNRCLNMDGWMDGWVNAQKLSFG